jgi:hypothetical protein
MSSNRIYYNPMTDELIDVLVGRGLRNNIYFYWIKQDQYAAYALTKAPRHSGWVFIGDL